MCFASCFPMRALMMSTWESTRSTRVPAPMTRRPLCAEEVAHLELLPPRAPGAAAGAGERLRCTAASIAAALSGERLRSVAASIAVAVAGEGLRCVRSRVPNAVAAAAVVLGGGRPRCV